MFYFYGRKKAIGKYYPAARYPTIIEPFAGSAAYSCRPENRCKRVILVEKDQRVVSVWRWLLDTQERDDVLGWHIPEIGEPTTDFFLHIHTASKQHTFGTLKCTWMMRQNLLSTQRVVSDDIEDYRHWEVIGGDYTDAPDIEATWFIDPPYEGEPGTGYKYGSDLIDYDKLGEWCRSRKGQVIVCEGAGARWLPFKLLTSQTTWKTNEEGIWTNIEEDMPSEPMPSKPRWIEACETTAKYGITDLRVWNEVPNGMNAVGKSRNPYTYFLGIMGASGKICELWIGDVFGRLREDRRIETVRAAIFRRIDSYKSYSRILPVILKVKPGSDASWRKTLIKDGAIPNINAGSNNSKGNYSFLAPTSVYIKHSLLDIFDKDPCFVELEQVRYCETIEHCKKSATQPSFESLFE